MNRPDGSPSTAAGPFARDQEDPQPASADPDPTAADDQSTPGGTVPGPTTDAGHDSGTGHGSDHYRPL
ncbi:hypothetical protein [Streptomyces sp. NPDC020917]|uniref:hypothetical protein n=1 Tax=Streptomyces sp. NPDC020917 TaxID=3365102 RepID=UPI00378A4DC9